MKDKVETIESLEADGYTREQAWRILESKRIRAEIEDTLDYQQKKLRLEFLKLFTAIFEERGRVMFLFGAYTALIISTIVQLIIERIK